MGQVLDDGFELFTASLVAVLPLSSAAALLTTIPTMLFRRYAEAQQAATPLDVDLGALRSVGAVAIVLWLAVLVLTTAIMARIDALAAGRSMTNGAALALGFRRWPTMLVVTVLFGVAVLGGTVLFIVPGMIFSIWFLFAPYVAALEGWGPLRSLGYGRDLVRGHWWRTAGLLTIVAIAAFVLYMILGVAVVVLMLMSPEAAAEGVVPWYVELPLNAVVSAVATPFATALLLAAYHDLKLRREGADLAARIAALA
jgi:hypothetical protein